jgi:hypothetical protein
MERLLASFTTSPRPVVVGLVLHVALALACAAALPLDLPPIQGVHPALKPLKFGLSIAIFLATMGLILPHLDVDPRVREALGWVLAVTMLIETTPIVVQAIRGTTSHFNTRSPLDAAAWRTMVAAIVVATVAMALVALLASARPLLGLDGALALAVRAGLWILLLAAWTGFAMGGRDSHSVGGEDGGVGLPFVHWSVRHGDLRAAHFFALHGLQVLPVLALLLSSLGVGERASTAIVLTSAALYLALCLGTAAIAFAGRPLGGSNLAPRLDALNRARSTGDAPGKHPGT